MSSSRTALDRYATSKDFVGAGNWCLGVLERPHQEFRPDDDARLIEERMPALIADRFGIDSNLSYHSVYRDTHLAAADRGTWSKDTYVDLIINAYVLGATRENLWLNELVPYFRATAERQIMLIRQAVADAAATKADPFADRLAKIQAEHERRKKMFPTLGLDTEMLERVMEAEYTRFREAVLALGDEFKYE